MNFAFLQEKSKGRPARAAPAQRLKRGDAQLLPPPEDFPYENALELLPETHDPEYGEHDMPDKQAGPFPRDKAQPHARQIPA